MRAQAVGIALAVALVVFATIHATLAAGLARRGAYLRAALALLVPPLAPFWGYQAGLRRAAWAWGAALALYTALLIGATLGAG